MRDTTNEITDAVVKGMPPAAVTFANQVFGVPIEKWLTVIMIIYTVLQIVVIVRDRLVRRKRESDKS